jgi:hypothetical protein
MTTLLNVNGTLTRRLTLLLRTCTAVVATRVKKKETREWQAPDPSELGPAPKHGVRR